MNSPYCNALPGSWIGVDLDGTLAEHEVGSFSPYRVGRPIPLMVRRVRKWISEGVEVRIVTARATPGADGKPDRAAIYAIELWCKSVLGQKLRVTNQKDYGMLELWDDRAVGVERDTGERVDGEPEPWLYETLKCDHEGLKECVKRDQCAQQCPECGVIVQ